MPYAIVHKIRTYLSCSRCPRGLLQLVRHVRDSVGGLPDIRHPLVEIRLRRHVRSFSSLADRWRGLLGRLQRRRGRQQRMLPRAPHAWQQPTQPPRYGFRRRLWYHRGWRVVIHHQRLWVRQRWHARYRHERRRPWHERRRRPRHERRRHKRRRPRHERRRRPRHDWWRRVTIHHWVLRQWWRRHEY